MTRNSPGRDARAADQIASQPGGPLPGLLQQARLFEQLDRQLKAEVDPQMAAHCQVACVRDGRLVVFTPTPVWRTRLNMLSAALLARLQRKGHPDISAIEIKVSPLLSSTETQKSPRQLSPAARQSLERFAEACSDPELGEIARRMVEPKD